MGSEDIKKDVALQHLPKVSTCMRAVTRGGHAYTETQLDGELCLRLKLYERSMGCSGRPLGNFRRLERPNWPTDPAICPLYVTAYGIC